MAVSVVAKFIADEWFKIMSILCFLLLAAALTLELKIDNHLVALLSTSGIFCGLAEMAFRPYNERLLLNRSGYAYGKVYGRARRINLAGCLLMVIALFFAAGGGWRGWMLLQSTL